MEAKGTLKDVSMDWKTGRMRLTFELESDVSSLIDKMKDKPLRITVKQWREKRSLDANAYYWVLLSRLQLTGIEVMFPKPGEFFSHTVDLGEIDAGSDFHRVLLFRQRK